jgi:hypothetical protein
MCVCVCVVSLLVCVLLIIYKMHGAMIKIHCSIFTVCVNKKTSQPPIKCVRIDTKRWLVCSSLVSLHCAALSFVCVNWTNPGYWMLPSVAESAVGITAPIVHWTIYSSFIQNIHIRIFCSSASFESEKSHLMLWWVLLKVDPKLAVNFTANTRDL